MPHNIKPAFLFNLGESFYGTSSLATTPGTLVAQRHQTTKITNTPYGCTAFANGKNVPAGNWVCETHKCTVGHHSSHGCSIDKALCPNINGHKPAREFTEVANGQKCATGKGGCNCAAKSSSCRSLGSSVDVNCSFPFSIFTDHPSAATISDYLSSYTSKGALTTELPFKTTNLEALDEAGGPLHKLCTKIYNSTECPAGHDLGCSGLLNTDTDINEICHAWIARQPSNGDTVKGAICAANPLLKECDCINRASRVDYNDYVQNFVGSLDQCWYKPCKGDDMADQLIQSEELQHGDCATVFCLDIINIEDGDKVSVSDVQQTVDCKAGHENGNGNGNGNGTPEGNGSIDSGDLETPLTVQDWIRANEKLVLAIFVVLFVLIGIGIFFA